MNRSSCSWRSALLAGLLLGPASVPAASLTVVEDRGGVSAAPYYQHISPEPDEPEPSSPLAPLEAAQGLPLRSTRLSPGPVSGQAIRAPGLSAFFLVGDDALSFRWLQQRGDRLRQLQAVGLVVNVESQERLEALRRAAPGLQLVPAAGDDLAERLGLKHYPVLVTSSALEQ